MLQDGRPGPRLTSVSHWERGTCPYDQIAAEGTPLEQGLDPFAKTVGFAGMAPATSLVVELTSGRVSKIRLTNLKSYDAVNRAVFD